MIASAQASAASMNATVTAGPAKSPAARAPTEKIPAPTATATPRIIRSQALSERLSSWPGSTASAIDRSEEHTSELQSLMRISYAVFCLKKKQQLIDSSHLYRDHMHTYT